MAKNCYLPSFQLSLLLCQWSRFLVWDKHIINNLYRDTKHLSIHGYSLPSWTVLLAWTGEASMWAGQRRLLVSVTTSSLSTCESLHSGASSHKRANIAAVVNSVVSVWGYYFYSSCYLTFDTYLHLLTLCQPLLTSRSVAVTAPARRQQPRMLISISHFLACDAAELLLSNLHFFFFF